MDESSWLLQAVKNGSRQEAECVVNGAKKAAPVCLDKSGKNQ